ncbi:MAG: LssY C-terminal domain-containing protein [Acidobacteriota bacterium]|nr:LssY C-terminal domain-containing protein [Acidobacteriota bacterium]
MLCAAEIPAGTNLEARLTTRVSSTESKPKEAVEALVIAPVLQDGQTLIPAGSTLTGTVITAVPVADVTKAARLRIDFNELHMGKRKIRLSTRLYEVDNARETVDETGTVQGISPKDTLTGRMDQGIEKMAPRHGALAAMLEAAKGVLVRNADPNISYGPGTELTLRLTKRLTLPAANSAAAIPPVPDDGHLDELIGNQPWQTFAARPPRPSDIINIMFIGSEFELHEAFTEAGWISAQALTGESKFETARAIIEQRGYKEAPVSALVLAGRLPGLVFEKGNNTFSARHHIRIWQSPDTYGGRAVWLSSASHDTGIDYSQQEMTFIHKIDSNIDLERQKVWNDLVFTGKVHAASLIDRPRIPKHFMNATGDDVETDGRMAVFLF